MIITPLHVVDHLVDQLQLLADSQCPGWVTSRLDRALSNEADSIRRRASVAMGQVRCTPFGCESDTDSRYGIWAETLLEITQEAMKQGSPGGSTAALDAVTDSLMAFRAAQTLLAEANCGIRVAASGVDLPLLRAHRLVYGTEGLPAFNCNWIGPRLLAGRNPLTSLDVQWLQARGVTHILDLRTPAEWSAPRFGEEALTTLRGRLERQEIPIEAQGAPTMEQFDEAVDYLQEWLRLPEAVVYVHGRAGKERTGAILIAYLARQQGLSYEAALALLQLRRPGLQPLPGQAEATRLWLQRPLG